MSPFSLFPPPPSVSLPFFPLLSQSLSLSYSVPPLSFFVLSFSLSLSPFSLSLPLSHRCPLLSILFPLTLLLLCLPCPPSHFLVSVCVCCSCFFTDPLFLKFLACLGDILRFKWTQFDLSLCGCGLPVFIFSPLRYIDIYRFETSQLHAGKSTGYAPKGQARHGQEESKGTWKTPSFHAHSTTQFPCDIYGDLSCGMGLSKYQTIHFFLPCQGIYQHVVSAFLISCRNCAEFISFFPRKQFVSTERRKKNQ